MDAGERRQEMEEHFSELDFCQQAQGRRLRGGEEGKGTLNRSGFEKKAEVHHLPEN